MRFGKWQGINVHQNIINHRLAFTLYACSHADISVLTTSTIKDDKVAGLTHFNKAATIVVRVIYILGFPLDSQTMGIQYSFWVIRGSQRVVLIDIRRSWEFV